MRIKNTIVILREVATCYPVLTQIGALLNTGLKKIATNEDRDDLKLLANAYLGVLKRQMDNGLWVQISQFHIVKPAPETSANTESKVQDNASGGRASTETASTSSSTKTIPPRETEDRRYLYCFSGLLALAFIMVGEL